MTVSSKSQPCKSHTLTSFLNLQTCDCQNQWAHWAHRHRKPHLTIRTAAPERPTHAPVEHRAPATVARARRPQSPRSKMRQSRAVAVAKRVPRPATASRGGFGLELFYTNDRLMHALISPIAHLIPVHIICALSSNSVPQHRQGCRMHL